MELILWRHAEAEDSVPDEARRLTQKGEKQAVKIAKWLKKRLEEPVRLLASPAIRAQQTAGAYVAEFETLAELDTGAAAAQILRATGWPKAKGTVIVVGHQPSLGQLAALLLTGKESNWDIKKGAIWWFQAKTLGGRTDTALRAVVPPGLA
jgi:phosphohistidine phosphatase